MTTATQPKRDAPFQVVGYDDLCSDFEYEFGTFFRAARAFIRLEKAGNNVVFITGVEPAVALKLRELSYRQ